MSSVGAEADHPGNRHSTVRHFVLAVHGIRLKSPRNAEYSLRDKDWLFLSLILMTACNTRNHKCRKVDDGVGKPRRILHYLGSGFQEPRLVVEAPGQSYKRLCPV